METIRLLTRDGAFVEDVQIPAFKTPPEAVMWGMRVFFRTANGEWREGLLYVIPPTVS